MCSCAYHVIKTAFELVFYKISKFSKSKIENFSLVQLIEIDSQPIENIQFLSQNFMPGSINAQFHSTDRNSFQILKAFGRSVFVLSHNFYSTPLDPS